MSEHEKRDPEFDAVGATDAEKAEDAIPVTSADPADDNIDDWRYDAFISYRHVALDRTWAKWLHAALETYRVPGGLVRRLGVRPKIKRVFRDEEELPVSSDLNREITTALNHSRFLIVICSKDTPASRWVDAEVAHFRGLGRHNRILALLVDGEPNESFPKSLVEIRRTVYDKSGATLEEIEAVEPLAADVRATRAESARVLSRMAKVRFLACILGCRFDDLRRRDEERAGRRRRVAMGAMAALLAVVSSLAVWAVIERGIAVQQRRLAVARLNDALGSYTALADNAQEKLKDRAGTKELQLELLEFAIAKLGELAPEDERKADRTMAVAMRNRGHLFALTGRTVDADRLLGRSLETMRRLVEEEPDDGDLLREYGTTLHQNGLLRVQMGETVLAERLFQEALAVREGLVREEGDNLTLLRGYGESLDYMGDALKGRGDDLGALEKYRRSLEVRREVEAGDADSLTARADVAEGMINIGDMERKLARSVDAIPMYREAADVLIELRRGDAYSMRYQRLLAIAENKLAGTAFALGDYEDAKRGWERSLAMIQDLASTDRGNLEWIRELSLCLRNLGLVEEALGNFEAARDRYDESLGRARALVAADGSDASAVRNLAGALELVGGANWRLGQSARAAGAFEDLLVVRRALVNLDGTNTGDTAEFEEALSEAGVVLTRVGKTERARAVTEELRRRIAERGGDAMGVARIDIRLAKLEGGEAAVERLRGAADSLNGVAVEAATSGEVAMLKAETWAALGEGLAGIGWRVEAEEAAGHAADLLGEMGDDAAVEARKAVVRTLAALANGVMFERPGEALPMLRRAAVLVEGLAASGVLSGAAEEAWPDYFGRVVERLEGQVGAGER